MLFHSYSLDDGEVIKTWRVEDFWQIQCHHKRDDIGDVEALIRKINNFVNSFNADDWVRVIEADLSYPPIVNLDGHILDGCHRIVKHAMLGHRWINVEVITKMPPPFLVEQVIN